MTAGVTHAGYGVTCPHCGGMHLNTCLRISAIDYDKDGKVKRVELHNPFPGAPKADPRSIVYLREAKS